MVIHFNSNAEAVAHLTTNGWCEIPNGNFISRDGSCAARIQPVAGDIVCVVFWEIENAA